MAATGWYHQHTEAGLRSAARLLATIHDASAGWVPRQDAVWGSPVVAAEEPVFCHGDPGPWNFVWASEEAIAARAEATMEQERSLARQGIEPQRTWVGEGSLEAQVAEVRWIREHRHPLE